MYREVDNDRSLSCAEIMTAGMLNRVHFVLHNAREQTLG